MAIPGTSRVLNQGKRRFGNESLFSFNFTRLWQLGGWWHASITRERLRLDTSPVGCGTILAGRAVWAKSSGAAPGDRTEVGGGRGVQK